MLMEEGDLLVGEAKEKNKVWHGINRRFRLDRRL